MEKNFSSLFVLRETFDSTPAGEPSGGAERAAIDGSSAVGGAMGMLSSLTSVVHTTVRRRSTALTARAAAAH